jgi:hypothetical protein
VTPFLADPTAYFWTAQPSNWNAVCHQGLVGAALALELEPQAMRHLLQLTEQHLQVFLDGFSAQGSCLEGITYWDYGFGWFVLLNEQLELWSGGAQSLVAGREDRIRSIARFGPAMMLLGEQLVNFADSRLDMPPRASLLMLLGQRLQLPECSKAGLQLYRDLLDRGLDLHGQRCDLFYLTRMLLEAPTAEALAAVQEPEGGDWIDTDAGLVVVRRFDAQGRCWELAVKGGHNDEPHNHNDCGSFLFNVDGERLAIELGAPEYTADTFGPKRYSLLATRSSGHSVPIVNGVEQAAGRTFAAELLQVEAGLSLVRVQLDLTRVYPAAAGLQRLVRTVELDARAGCLRVEDALWGDGEMRLESVLMSTTDQLDRLAVQPMPGTVLDRVEPLHFRNNTGEEIRVWRWHWRPTDHCLTATTVCIGYLINP